MSRRTKLTITALFLVLLGVVALYAVRVWTVKEPLRFQLVGVSRPVRGTPPYEDWRLIKYEIEARNVSSVPVSIDRVFVHLGVEDEVWFEHQGRKISRSSRHREGIYIGGHKTVQMDLYFYTGLTDDDELYPWDITYEWEVPLLARLNSWLRLNAPGPLRFRIQELDPSYSEATLEIASGSHLQATPAERSKR